MNDIELRADPNTITTTTDMRDAEAVLLCKQIRRESFEQKDDDLWFEARELLGDERWRISTMAQALRWPKSIRLEFTKALKNGEATGFETDGAGNVWLTDQVRAAG